MNAGEISNVDISNFGLVAAVIDAWDELEGEWGGPRPTFLERDLVSELINNLPAPRTAKDYKWLAKWLIRARNWNDEFAAPLLRLAL